jgi:hypothetical protein
MEIVSRMRNAMLVPSSGALTSSARYSSGNEDLEGIIMIAISALDVIYSRVACMKMKTSNALASDRLYY